jgi:hypothetical protein
MVLGRRKVVALARRSGSSTEWRGRIYARKSDSGVAFTCSTSSIGRRRPARYLPFNDSFSNRKIVAGRRVYECNGDLTPTETLFDPWETIWHPSRDMDAVCPLCRSSAAVDLTVPPHGAWFEQLADGFRTGAITRSWMALFIVPFTCVWSGISLSGIYGKQISSGQFDPTSALFGLPFLIGSFFLIGYCAMTITGKVELAQRCGSLSVFTGVGPIGWTRKYLWSDFSSVREDSRRSGFNWNRQGVVIVLEGKRRAAFGTMLTEERRYFVLSVVQQKVRNSNQIQTAGVALARFR